MKKALLFPACWIIAIVTMTYTSAQTNECEWNSSSNNPASPAIVVLHTGMSCNIIIPEGGSIHISANAGYDAWRISSAQIVYRTAIITNTK